MKDEFLQNGHDILSYNVAAERLKKLAKRNMRVLKRKNKIKRICLKDQKLEL